MMVRRFLILFDKLNITESDVKSGTNDSDVSMACRCVNVGLFLSKELRRDVILSIAIRNEVLDVISFPGSEIKRVSPDERSIAFFLLKAINQIELIDRVDETRLPNNIEVKKCNMMQLLKEWNPHQIYLSTITPYRQREYIDLKDDSLFIFSIPDIDYEFQHVDLPRPPNPERFIIDVNNWFDGILDMKKSS